MFLNINGTYPFLYTQTSIFVYSFGSASTVYEVPEEALTLTISVVVPADRITISDPVIYPYRLMSTKSKGYKLFS
jgi:hypothetical protein